MKTPMRRTPLMRWVLAAAMAISSMGFAACTGTPPSKTAPTSAPTTSTSTSSPLPAGWETVTYHGVGIDVPNNWAVELWRPTCGVAVPTVFIGPAKPFAIACVSDPPMGAEVVLGALPMSGSKTVSTKLNGIMAYVATQYEVYHGNLGATITNIWVSLPTKDMNISVSVGESPAIPGGAPGRAEQIVQTIHQVS